MIFLVRHAKAGHRTEGDPEDWKRPLSPSGWKQAEALVEPLLKAGATGPLLASPYPRCRQTLEPLGEQLEMTVQTDERLSEGQPFEPVLELLQSAPSGTVLCSHGDVIPDVIDALDRRRVDFTNAPNWKKASVWVLTRGSDGRIVSAESWPPPEI